MASIASPTKDITAILNYTDDNGKTPWLYDRPLTKHDKHTTKFYVPIEPVAVTIHDGRARNDLTLDGSSFELVSQTTTLAPEDFYTNPDNKIENTYYPEMEAFLEQHLGAAKVMIFNHQVRNEVKSSSGGSVVGYARGIHVDYAPSWAEEHFCDLLQEKLADDEREIARLSKGRFVLLNAWRSISHQPIQQDTLAVCDEGSVIRPDDYIASDFYGKTSSGKQIRMASRNASKHRWYYYPQMTRDDVLLMKMYDSDTTKAARSCFHTAFTDPTAPDDAPARESIEIRAVAYFPDYEPNTCPPLSRGTKVVAQASDITASEAEARIRTTVENLFFFPLPVQWMYRYAMRSGRTGAPAVIQMLLADPGNRLGLERAHDSVKADATALLLKDDKFATRADMMKQRLEQAILERRRLSPWTWWLSPYNW
jgi:hypothetical protein